MEQLNAVQSLLMTAQSSSDGNTPTLHQTGTSSSVDTTSSTISSNSISSLQTKDGSMAPFLPSFIPISTLQSVLANYYLNLSHFRQLQTQSLMNTNTLCERKPYGDGGLSLTNESTPTQIDLLNEEEQSRTSPTATEDDSPNSNERVMERAESKKKKGTRRTFSDEQVAKLETYFDYKRYFTPIERTKIAEELLLSETQIKTWFQNRRAKNKRDENEKREQEQLRFRQLSARAKLMSLGSRYPYPTSLVARFQNP